MFISLWHLGRHTPDWKNRLASKERGHSCSRGFIRNEITTAHAPSLAMSSWKIRFRDTGLQRLPMTRDLRHSKESDKVAFWWRSIKEKPLKLF